MQHAREFSYRLVDRAMDCCVCVWGGLGGGRIVILSVCVPVCPSVSSGADTGFSEGGGVMATRGGGGVIGGDRPCRRKITIKTHKMFSYKGG